jgi:hypothetical protein
MAQEVIQRCDCCGEIIDFSGDEPPIVVRMVVGVPQSLGEGAYYDPETLPSFVRAMLKKLHANRTWCVSCAGHHIRVDDEEVAVIAAEAEAEQKGHKRPEKVDLKLRDEARAQYRASLNIKPDGDEHGSHK